MSGGLKLVNQLVSRLLVLSKYEGDVGPFVGDQANAGASDSAAAAGDQSRFAFESLCHPSWVNNQARCQTMRSRRIAAA